MPAKN